MGDLLFLIGAAILLIFVTIFAFASRYKRCPSDKILVVYGRVGGESTDGRGLSAKCYHGGGAFIWPVIQDYQYLDLTPMSIDIKLEGALSQQNIRINTPSTFTVGISTEQGIMENAAERLLGLSIDEVKELVKDIIFGQLRVVIATMPIEEINADREKLIENIYLGVEVELKKIGLRLINVNIQDISDSSGYIDALGKEAAARAINEAKIKVAEQQRDGETGSAEALRDQRINVASADATAVEGENRSKVLIAQSNAQRREKEAEAERIASAAEKVKQAQAMQEAYTAEEKAERERARREEATQYANIVIPAEIEKQRIETLAEAEAEQTRRLKKGEADGVLSMMSAEGDGLKAILTKKAEGFKEIVESCGGSAQLAAMMLVTEQLPDLVKEQVKAISNLKIDSITVWDQGRKGDGKTSTADFLAGMVGSLPPIHDLTKNVGLQLPEFLGKIQSNLETNPQLVEGEEAERVEESEPSTQSAEVDKLVANVRAHAMNRSIKNEDITSETIHETLRSWRETGFDPKTKWYYNKGKKKNGPYSWDELVETLKNNPKTYVTQADSNLWLPMYVVQSFMESE